MPAQRTLEVNGYDVACAVGGSGPPLLYLHGEGATSGWAEVHDALAASRTVFAPVHPGFGGSPLPDWLTSMDDLAFHTVDLLDALDLREPLTVVGSSFGGWLAMALTLLRPGRVRALVLAGPLGLRPQTPMPDLFIRSGPEVLATLSPRLDAARVDPLNGDADAATELWLDQAAQARVMWERPYDTKLVRRSHHLRAVPSTVLWGAQDLLLPPEEGRRLAALIGASLTVVEGAGHLLAIDAPSAVADAVTTLTTTIGAQQ